MSGIRYRPVGSDVMEVPIEPDEKFPRGTSKFCAWLCPHDPMGAERRVGDLYWNGWSSFVLGFALSGVGLTLLTLAILCFYFTWDVPRSIALIVVSAICIIPGLFSLVVIWFYISGKEGYDYEQLMPN